MEIEMKPFLPFIIPTILIILGCLFYKSSNYLLDGLIGPLLLIIGVALLLITLITCPLYRYNARENIIKYRETQQTIARIREKGDSVERAALIHKLIEANRWLKGSQYWSEGAFEFYWPKEIRELKPLE